MDTDHPWALLTGLVGCPIVGGIALGLIFHHENCTEYACSAGFNMGAAAYATPLSWGLTAAGAAFLWYRDAERANRISDSARTDRATILVPNVTGIDQARATAELERSNLLVVVVEYATTNPSEDGCVLAQHPPGGTYVHEGANAVKLSVARSI